MAIFKVYRIVKIITIMTILPLLACSTHDIGKVEGKAKQVAVLATADSAENVKPKPVTKSVNLVAVGDNLIHSNIFKGAKIKNTYDFSSLYENVAKVVYGADFAVINQETIMAGSKYGYSGYPAFNTPQQMAYDLQKTGFDLITLANNHALDQKGQGLADYLSFLKKVKGIEYLGAYNSKVERDTPHIVEKNGIKMAFLSYTYGSNVALPKGKGYMLPILDKELIKRNVLVAKAQADVIIVFVHWGTENSFTPTQFQRDMAAYMNSLGVDLIIGSHPHVLQPAEWIAGKDGKQTFVAYSLGNFISGQKARTNLLGGMLSVVIEKGETGIEIKQCKIVPLVTHYEPMLRNTKVYFLENYTNSLAASHGVKAYDKPISLEYFKSIVEKTLGPNKGSLPLVEKPVKI